MASPSLTRICSLPTDVLFSIFSFLPISDLAQCAAVCKRWHGIVTEFSSLWKGKRYVTNRSPRESAATRAVLRALPPFPELSVETAYRFAMDVSYPHLVLSVTEVGAIEHCHRLRCKCLTGSLDIVGAILSYRSTIDSAALRKLRILRSTAPNLWALPICGVEYVVGFALDTFPNLEELSVCAEFLSAHYLDALEGISRLRKLEIECIGLESLEFLLHCSGELEELQLVGCSGLPSREYAELHRLVNLRRLRLSHCSFKEGDLAAAVVSLSRLESLQLNRCGFVADLSFLQHCGDLRRLCVTNSTAPKAVVTVRPAAAAAAAAAAGQPWLRNLRLPAAPDRRSRGLVSVTLSVGEPSAALPQLEQLGLAAGCLDYLGALLRGCSRLRHFCCEFVCQPHERQLFNARVHIDLSTSAQT